MLGNIRIVHRIDAEKEGDCGFSWKNILTGAMQCDIMMQIIKMR